MSTKLSGLRALYFCDGCEDDTPHYREAFVSDLVEALLEQGAEKVSSIAFPSGEHGAPVGTNKPGRYLVFRMEEEK